MEKTKDVKQNAVASREFSDAEGKEVEKLKNTLEDAEEISKEQAAQVNDENIFKSKYEICNELGRGHFGIVYKVKDKANGEVLAAKFVRCRKSEDKQKCKDEISIMNILESPRLLRLIGTCTHTVYCSTKINMNFP